MIALLKPPSSSKFLGIGSLVHVSASITLLSNNYANLFQDFPYRCLKYSLHCFYILLLSSLLGDPEKSSPISISISSHFSILASSSGLSPTKESPDSTIIDSFFCILSQIYFRFLNKSCLISL